MKRLSNGEDTLHEAMCIVSNKLDMIYGSIFSDKNKLWITNCFSMPAKYKKWKNINLMNFLNDEILIFGGYKMRYIYDKYSEAEENDLLASEYFRPDFPFYSCGISAGL